MKPQLTKGEAVVLANMCKGLSNKEIADLLFVTEGAVKFHTANIYKKLGVKNRIGAALKALRGGLDTESQAKVDAIIQAETPCN